MLVKVVAGITGISALMLIVLLLTTAPADTGPLGILGFFVFLYLTALGVLTFLFQLFRILLFRFLPSQQKSWRVRDITLRQSYYYASVIAAVPVMFIAIQTVGEVGVYQILLIFFFAVIAWIYVSNRTA